jgi:hypothetical protein
MSKDHHLVMALDPHLVMAQRFQSPWFTKTPVLSLLSKATIKTYLSSQMIEKCSKNWMCLESFRPTTLLCNQRQQQAITSAAKTCKQMLVEAKAEISS